MTVPIVHVVDDDADLRSALTRLLRAEGYDVRAHASAGDFLLAPSEPASGCVVLDLQMPGPSGLDLQHALQRHPTRLPIVFLTGQGDVAASVQAMKAGAVDFLTKPVEPGALVQAVAAALARDHDQRERQAAVREAEVRFARLSERERSVYRRVIAGRLNKQIGAELGIAERTVKMHRAQIMQKMEAASLAELVHTASLLDHSGPAPRSTSER